MRWSQCGHRQDKPRLNRQQCDGSRSSTHWPWRVHVKRWNCPGPQLEAIVLVRPTRDKHLSTCHMSRGCSASERSHSEFEIGQYVWARCGVRSLQRGGCMACSRRARNLGKHGAHRKSQHSLERPLLALQLQNSVGKAVLSTPSGAMLVYTLGQCTAKTVRFR